MKTKNLHIGFFAVFLFCSCSNFLEEKPDIKMVIPQSLDDATLLLNDYTIMNTGYPVLGEWGTDEYYVTDQTFDGTINIDQRNAYTWIDQPYNDPIQWQRPYKAVYNANQVLAIISKLKTTEDVENMKQISGIASFFRAFAFQQLAEVFAPSYRVNTASSEMGIPLRLEPGIDEPSVRASLQQSYDQIIQDYKTAGNKLPIEGAIHGRPFRASAYAGLARAYLNMANYQQAYLYADSCLQLNADLMDFNLLKATDNLPVPKFNVEVLFPALTAAAGPMNFNNSLVDSVLYKSYGANDLRKGIFFRKNTFPKDSYTYKGSYDKSTATLFVGLTTSEAYLVKAECAVRIGKINEALTVLNTLLKNRFAKNQFVAVTETDPDILLSLVLKERQKELLFRGRRWSDLKRLNAEPRFQKTIKRVVKGVEYQLESNSRKYAFRLPEPAVTIGKLPQNTR